MRETIPLLKRPVDIPILAFFLVNILFITYIVDLEQLVIDDPASFQYPIWPLPFMVDLVHWWGNNFDPVLIARPAWWRVTIWLDAILFGPFYVVAIYAYIRGREWIRVPSFLYSAMLLTNVCVILGEEFFGTHATPRPGLVLLVNLPWLLFPIYITARMWIWPRPFTRKAHR